MVPQSLIDRCLREEPKAQYELYQALYGHMMAICSRYERNKEDALDRMNQGFLKILTHLAKRRLEVPFEAWMRRIMINTVIDAYRNERERKAHETLEDPPDAMILTEANGYLQEMEAEAFAELLRRVPDMSRRVFNLFAIDGFTHAEIATLLGISTGTSKWHVSHARQQLQQAILRQAHATAAKTA